MVRSSQYRERDVMCQSEMEKSLVRTNDSNKPIFFGRIGNILYDFLLDTKASVFYDIRVILESQPVTSSQAAENCLVGHWCLF